MEDAYATCWVAEGITTTYIATLIIIRQQIITQLANDIHTL